MTYEKARYCLVIDNYTIFITFCAVIKKCFIPLSVLSVRDDTFSTSSNRSIPSSGLLPVFAFVNRFALLLFVDKTRSKLW